MLRRDFVKIVPAAAGAMRPARSAAPWPRYAGSMPLELRIPNQHPYLAFTPDQIARTRQRAANTPWVKEEMNHLVAEAEGAISMPPDRLPKPGDVAHRAVGGRLFTVAVAYALSGDRRFAEWTRDGLLAYAALYPGLSRASATGQKLFTSSLSEATWAVSIAQAYDLAAGKGIFTAEQARRVETDVLRAAAECFQVKDFDHDPRLRNMHFRCYNFQAWHLAAVGLVGLAVKDPEMVDWAVNSPYGLRHMVGHDINDDGIFWERSVGYHQYVIKGLITLTEPLARCGVDVYNMSVPADRSHDQGEHYSNDTSDRAKSLRMMFEAPFYLTFPDLTYPAVGDSGRGPLRANPADLVGFNRYGGSKVAWLLLRRRPEKRYLTVPREVQFGPDWYWIAYDWPAEAPASLPVQEGRFANTGEYRNGCSLFPSTGLAILRQASGDYTQQPDSTAVSLSFGPHGGGHGHSDMLNLVLYAQGRQWIPDSGSMPYESHWKGEWTAQTVSHNTVVVDQISQKPTGRSNRQWPTDDARDRVVGALERFDAGTKSVTAYCERAYDGIRLSRAVRVEGPWVVDAFTAMDSKGAVHQYDFVLHVDGQLEDSSAPLAPRSGKLGEMCGYQLVEQRQGGTAAGAFHLTFASEGKKLRLWVPGEGATEVIVAEGLTNSPDRKMAMLVLRRQAAETRFITVMEPLGANHAIREVRIEKATVAIESAKGTRRAPLE